MSVFVITEMADIEIVGQHVRFDRKEADKVFDAICQENQIYDHDDLSAETSGTVRLAGDDSFSAQMIEIAEEACRG